MEQKYIGLHDLISRWIYTPQGLRKLVRNKHFPSPVFSVNNGKTNVWLLSDIEAYEAKNKSVLNEHAKRQKMLYFARLNNKDTADE
jgi:hypothetical protein